MDRVMPAVNGEQLDLIDGKKATIAKRPKTDAELSDATCTPKWLNDLLPTVDLDPLSNERSTVKARRTYDLSRGQDALKLPWHGTVHENWPFSAPEEFAKKTIEEMASGRCTDAIVIAKHDEGTEWWSLIMQPIMRKLGGKWVALLPEKWAFNKRIQYDEHPDLIERRRLDQRAKLIKEGKPLLNKRGEERATGKSQANFTSVILHHRGVFPNGKRRPRLDLSSVARLWLPIDDLTTEIYC
jgi:hypothetical protein